MRKIKPIITIVFLSSILYFNICFSQDKYYAEANNFYELGRYDESIKLYKELALLKKDREKAIEGIIANFIKLKDVNQIKNYVSNLSTNNPNKLFVEGYIAEFIGDRWEALKKYKEFLQQDEKKIRKDWYQASLLAIKRLNAKEPSNFNWVQDSLLKMSETNVVLPRFFYGGFFYNNQLYLPLETDTNEKTLSLNSKLFKYDKFLGTLDNKLVVSNIQSKYFIAGLTVDTISQTVYFSRQQFDVEKKVIKAREKEKLPISEQMINEFGLYQSKVIDKKEINTNYETIQPFEYTQKNYSIIHPCLYDKGNKMIFSSNMPGALGGFDLFYVVKMGENKWSKPMNLGLEINTTGDEFYPFVWNDSILFFSSNGHKGFGNFDIYMCYRQMDQFLEPKNVGSNLNSPADDVGLIMTNKYQGIFFSNRNYFKKDQMFLFELPKNTFKISANVINKKNMTSVPNAYYEVYSGDTLVFKGLADNEGRFEIKNLFEREYTIKLNQPGFNVVSYQVKPGTALLYISPLEVKKPEVYDDKTFNEEEFAKNFKVGDILRFNNVLFEYGKYNLLAESKEILDKVANFLLSKPSVKIELSAHTDSRSSHKFNNLLSQNRAKACKDYLISKGVKAENILAKGYGKTRILNRCTDGVSCSEEEHAINRRVEFKILSE